MLLGSSPTSTEEAEAPEGFALPSSGTVIDGRYRITRSIGAGGMGAVFEAEQLAVGRRCALKFLKAELVGRSRSAARFRREARLLGKLEHEHLTAVLDYGAYLGKSPFLVMEYLEGRTLKQVFEEQAPLPLDTALEVLLQVARGMAYVHQQQVVHRDLKPANLMLIARSERPWVKILDFGIARDWQEVGGQLTPSGAELGTAHYMSPEQARGAKQVDPRSDVYALGAIAYEALTGARVHPGDSYNEVIFHLLTQPHRPLREVAPTCPSAVQAMVERCLEKDPERRYVDAGALADELADLRLQTDAESRSHGSSPRARPSFSGRGAPTRWLVTGALLGSGMTAAVGMLTMRDRMPGSSNDAGSLDYRSPSAAPAPAATAQVVPNEQEASPKILVEAKSESPASASPIGETVAPGRSTEGSALPRSRKGTAPVPQPARLEPARETSGNRAAPASPESMSNQATVPAAVESSSPPGSPRFLTSNPYGAN